MRGIGKLAVLLLLGGGFVACSPLPAPITLGDTDTPDALDTPDSRESEPEPDASETEAAADGDGAETEEVAQEAEETPEGEEGEEESEAFPWTCPNEAAYCERSADCLSGQVCLGGCCQAACTPTSCFEGQVCNPKNGYCEYCGQGGEEACVAGQCCNYAGFWYCGSCCVPACKPAERCVSGACQEMACPSDCGANGCCDAKHGYSCYDCTDGDMEMEEGGDPNTNPMPACTPADDLDTPAPRPKAAASVVSCALPRAVFPLRTFTDLAYSAPYLFANSTSHELLLLNETALQQSTTIIKRHPDWLHTPHPGLLVFPEDGELWVYKTTDFIANGAPLSRTPLGKMDVLPRGERLVRSFFGDCTALRVDTITEQGELIKGALQGFGSPGFPISFHGLNASAEGMIGIWVNSPQLVSTPGTGTIWRYLALDATDPQAFGPAYKLFEGYTYLDEYMFPFSIPIWSFMRGDLFMVENVPDCTVMFFGILIGCGPPDPPALYSRQEAQWPLFLRRLPAGSVPHTFKEWQGDTLWAQDGNDLIRYDFSSLTTLEERSRYTQAAPASALKAVGDRVYTLSNELGLQAIEMPSSGAPTLAFEKRLALPFHDNVGDLFFTGGYLWAYVGHELFLLDPAHPESTQPVATVPLTSVGPMVALSDRLLIIGDYDALDIIDLSVPGAPTRLYSGVPLGAPPQSSHKALRAPISGSGLLRGNILYTALDILTATDISDPRAPVRLWSLGELSFGAGLTGKRPHSLQRIGESLVAVYELNGEQTFVTFPAIAPSQTNATRTLSGRFEAVGWWGTSVVVLQTVNGQRVLNMIDFSDPLAPKWGKSVVRPDLTGQVGLMMEKDGFLTLANYTTRVLHILDPQDPTRDRFTVPLEQNPEAFVAAPGGPQNGLYLATSCAECDTQPPYSLALYDVAACAAP